MAVAELVTEKTSEEEFKVHPEGIEEVVADKGYHSGAVLANLENAEVRTYIPEKKQPGKRHWEGKAEEQQAVYANRRRVKGAYGQRLLRKRGELIERNFAHCYETGGMRRTHLRGRENILKRLLIHVGAFNLSLIIRTLVGSGTPRELRNCRTSLIFVFLFWYQGTSEPARLPEYSSSSCKFSSTRNHRYLTHKLRHSERCDSATGCYYSGSRHHAQWQSAYRDRNLRSCASNGGVGQALSGARLA